MAGYKINAHKLVAFLYTNNEAASGDFKESIPFTIIPKSIRYWGIHLTEEFKGCTLKTVEHLWKKLRKTQRDGKPFHAHGLEEEILLKCLYYPKHSRHSMQSPSKYH